MHELIAWCGFVGGWLLVAGPIYQAAIELEEEGYSREDIDAVRTKVPTRPSISPWWWLLPPLAYVLQRRQGRAYREAVMTLLDAEQIEGILRFSGKATGWLFVAGGAFLIAVKETWELHEAYAWPTFVVWVLVVVMIFLAAMNTVLRIRRDHDIIAKAGPRPAAEKG